MRERIVRNAAKCRQCDDEIESEHRHDFKWCKCGAIAVDGGKDYLRRAAKDPTDIIELSEAVEEAATPPIEVRQGFIPSVGAVSILRVERAAKRLPVCELFGPTLQGEGALAGQRTMFVRFGYCDGAGDGWCRLCDSMFAVDPKHKGEWHWMTPSEICTELLAQRGVLALCRHVTLSGGNPALHDLEELVARLHGLGFKVHVETQGTVFRRWLLDCETVIVSPKPPSMGRCNLERLDAFMESVVRPYESPRVVLKVVVDPDDDADYEFARLIMVSYDADDHCLSVLTKPDDTREVLIERYRRLAERVCADHDIIDVAVLPQLHVLLWGHRRGV